MRACLTGPPQSGKTTLFAAVAEAGGSHVDIHRPDQLHLAVVKVPDERLDWLADLFGCDKVIHPELEFLDLPGFDLSDEAGRNRAKAHWPAMRQSDMPVFVVREFADQTVPAWRGRIDPRADVEEFVAEMLFADLDQATARIGKLTEAIRKPTAQRQAQQQELELMKRLAEALEADRPIQDAIRGELEERFLRSFAFLSQKPAIAVLNRDESKASEEGPARLGPLPCLSLSAKIEEELAQLPEADRDDFLADLGLDWPARNRLIRACYERMKLVTFFTHTKSECRGWTVPEGTDAVTAAGNIHTDIARGFIRAETVAFEDLRAAGDTKSAKAAGKIRLEGKNYTVRDGDVIYFRFNV